jgi:hypothetical protein
MKMKMKKEVPIQSVTVNDPFWSKFQSLVTDVVIPYQEKILGDEIPGVEKSHALANFAIAAGQQEGEFYGMVFQDSDVAKWLEAAAYSLAIKPDTELEKRVDDIIETIGKAQADDGYLNTYFTIKEPEHRWQNLQECHELYCAGHMMEAAVAYYETSGKDRLLKIMEKMADHIDARFGHGKETGVPGHQEVEIGLMRMYWATGKEKYKKLAQFFIDQRGQDPEYFAKEAEKRGWAHFGMDPVDQKYSQIHAPVREQTTAEGHSVRAVYMYTAMASLAAELDDPSLKKACQVIWDNITNKRMYITGGIGSTVKGEAFTIDYDLPNDTVYAETCASVGLIFFARKMLDMDVSNRYADVMELALYNGVLSGMQLDGKRFFYVNPLEVNPGISGKLHNHEHVLPERPGWYACACCPPNVARLVTSLAKYAWGEDEQTIYSHLYLGGTAEFEKADVSLVSNYPWEGNIKYTVAPKQEEAFALAIRIPGWVKEVDISLNGEKLGEDVMKNGYMYIQRVWQADDVVDLTMKLPIRKIYANTAVREDAGQVSIMRGPIVYVFEGVDNGEQLQALRIRKDGNIQVIKEDKNLLENIRVLEVEGLRVKTEEKLYSETRPTSEPVMLTAIPYFTWGNRGLNQMRVWMYEEC